MWYVVLCSAGGKWPLLIKLLQVIVSGEASTVAFADCGLFPYKITSKSFFLLQLRIKNYDCQVGMVLSVSLSV